LVEIVAISGPGEIGVIVTSDILGFLDKAVLKGGKSSDGSLLALNSDCITNVGGFAL